MNRPIWNSSDSQMSGIQNQAPGPHPAEASRTWWHSPWRRLGKAGCPAWKPRRQNQQQTEAGTCMRCESLAPSRTGHQQTEKAKKTHHYCRDGVILSNQNRNLIWFGFAFGREIEKNNYMDCVCVMYSWVRMVNIMCSREVLLQEYITREDDFSFTLYETIIRYRMWFLILNILK